MIRSTNYRHVVLFIFATLSLTLFLSVASGGFAQTATPKAPIVPVWETAPPYPTDVSFDQSEALLAVGTLRAFSAVADAEVQQAKAATNFGIEPTFGAGYDNYVDYGLKKRALIRFDTTTYLPPDTIIHSATMKLYFTGYCDAYTTSYQAYRITNDWFEMSVNWNNQPGFAEAYGAQSIPADSSWGYYAFDVTGLVQNWVNGAAPEYGIMLRGPETPPYDCAYRDFLSKGGGGFTAEPILEVDYTLPATALTVSQNSIDIYHECGTGSPLPTPVMVDLETNDNTLRNWSSSTGGVSWLQLSKSSGKVSRIFPDQIELSVSETGSCPATSKAQIQITAPGLANYSQTIDVTLHEVENLWMVYLPVVLNNYSSVANSGLMGETAVTQATVSANRIVFIIGIADYQYATAPASFSPFRSNDWGDGDLIAPFADVHTGKQAFTEDGDYCTLSLLAQATNEVIVVLSEELATKENIDYAFQWIDEREDAHTEIVIYFSGHGGQVNDMSPLDEPGDHADEFLSAYDMNDTPQFVNYLLDDDLDTQLAALESEHLAVIVDACFSGGLDISNPHYAFLAASLEDQSSWESSELEHGVATYYITEALLSGGGDTNGDGWLSVQELYNYANGRVSNYVNNYIGATQNLYVDITSDVNVARVLSCP